jgi:hypothetical protein
LLAVGVATVDGVADLSIYALPPDQLPKAAVAAWVIRSAITAESDAQRKQIDYWKTANAVSATAATESSAILDTTVFAAPDNPVQQVRVSTFKGTMQRSGKLVSEQIWSNLFQRSVRFLDDDRITGTLHEFLTIKDMGLIDTS